METRTRLYLAVLVTAATAYVVAVVPFTGRSDLVEAAVSAAVFVVALVLFERLLRWAESRE